jgi:hypothetical protein
VRIYVTAVAEVVPWLAASLLGLGTRAVGWGLMWLTGPWLVAGMMLLGAGADAADWAGCGRLLGLLRLPGLDEKGARQPATTGATYQAGRVVHDEEDDKRECG